MSHFFWLLATCFQEGAFLSAEQLRLWCFPRTHGQEDGAGDAVRLVSPDVLLPPPWPLMPPLCHVPAIVAVRPTCQAKLGDVLAAGLLSCKQMLARACSAYAHSWLWRESLLHGEPAVGCGVPGLCSSREEREGGSSPRAVILCYQTAAAHSAPSPGQIAKAFRRSNQIIRQASFRYIFTDNPKDIEEKKKSMFFQYKMHCKTLSLLGSFVIPSYFF